MNEDGKMFGLTSGTVTTLGLIIGLYKSTKNVAIIIVGILSIALSDSFSDGLGFYYSQLVDHDPTGALNSGLTTFLFKLLIALSFIIPFMIFNIDLAVIIAIIYGTLLIIYVNWFLERNIMQNVIMSWIVIILCYFGSYLVNTHISKIIQS